MKLGALVILAVVGVLAAVAIPSGCAHAPAPEPGYHFTAAADGGYVFSPTK